MIYTECSAEPHQTWRLNYSVCEAYRSHRCNWWDPGTLCEVERWWWDKLQPDIKKRSIRIQRYSGRLVALQRMVLKLYRYFLTWSEQTMCLHYIRKHVFEYRGVYDWARLKFSVLSLFLAGRFINGSSFLEQTWENILAGMEQQRLYWLISLSFSLKRSSEFGSAWTRKVLN